MNRAHREGVLPPPSAWAGPSAGAFESLYPESDAVAFARAAIFTICSAGVSAWEARRTYARCMVALEAGCTARMGFRHPAKADAIDTIWRDRDHHYRRYCEADDRMAALGALPGIGPVTKHRLALALELFEPASNETTEEQMGVVRNAF